MTSGVAKVPSHSCPRYVSARIRKILAAKGFPMHKMTGRYAAFGGSQRGTEGFSASKVGCSKRVGVHYYGAYSGGGSHHVPREVRQARMAEAIAHLRSLGYRVDDAGYVDCDHYDECD